MGKAKNQKCSQGVGRSTDPGGGVRYLKKKQKRIGIHTKKRLNRWRIGKGPKGLRRSDEKKNLSINAWKRRIGNGEAR